MFTTWLSHVATFRAQSAYTHRYSIFTVIAFLIVRIVLGYFVHVLVPV